LKMPRDFHNYVTNFHSAFEVGKKEIEPYTKLMEQLKDNHEAMNILSLLFMPNRQALSDRYIPETAKLNTDIVDEHVERHRVESDLATLHRIGSRMLIANPRGFIKRTKLNPSLNEIDLITKILQQKKQKSILNLHYSSHDASIEVEQNLDGYNALAKLHRNIEREVESLEFLR